MTKQLNKILNFLIYFSLVCFIQTDLHATPFVYFNQEPSIEISNEEEITHLYVFRHGQSDSNVSRIMSGGGDILASLTEEGKNQAADLGRKMSKKGIYLQIIYSSDLLRTIQTAELVSKELPSETKILLAPQLREILYGPYERTPAKERSEQWNSTIDQEIKKIDIKNISEAIECGILDRFHIWKIEPQSGNISDENPSIKRIETYFDDTNPVVETPYEFYLRIHEEFVRIAEESRKQSYNQVGLSTHGAALSSMIVAATYLEKNVFLPPHYTLKEIVQGEKIVMPMIPKIFNCALAHFRYHHKSKKLEFCGFIE